MEKEREETFMILDEEKRTLESGREKLGELRRFFDLTTPRPASRSSGRWRPTISGTTRPRPRPA
jgi:hypothetical protein